MHNSLDIIKKLREYAKDEDSFNELLSLFTEGDASAKLDKVDLFNSNGNQCNFTGYYWTHFNLENLSKMQYSDSVKTILGYSSDELNSMQGKLLSLVHQDDFEMVKHNYTNLITGSNNSDCNIQYRVLSKNKELLWISETFYVEKDQNDEVITCNSLSYDISEFMSSQKNLEAVCEDLKTDLEERDKFINIISHDLRSPFTSLLGFSEILINEPNLSDTERSEYLSYIYESGKTQLQFINHLLDWSRLKTGKIKIEPKRVNLLDIISNRVSLATRIAISKDIDIKISISPDIFVSADERLLGDSITNLLTNSIKFSEKHKLIYVSANKFKEGMIEVVVKDEGIGISEENQAKLFRIDQKFIGKGTQGEKGSGMGLNLVKEIIDHHDGEVWFYSEIGEGSEFHFTIPQAQNIILIVEDDIEIRHLYKKLIDNCNINYRVFEASNGYEAMSKIFAEMPSLVITDHDMPLMNGVQLVEAIRKKDRRNAIPILVVSAKFDDDVKSKYMQQAVEVLLEKPLDTTKFMEHIRSSLKIKAD
jgi:two-component system sensor histidine kinase/response regulator